MIQVIAMNFWKDEKSIQIRCRINFNSYTIDFSKNLSLSKEMMLKPNNQSLLFMSKYYEI